jgi:hypothetical protein
MLQKWRGELGWHAGNKQATKFAANFQLSISLIDLGIFLSFLLRCLFSFIAFCMLISI